jgi:hypothetical protein
MATVETVDREKKTVLFEVNGTKIKFVLYDGLLVELCRFRDAGVYDRANQYIQVEEYNKIKKQAYAILTGR